MVAERRGFKVAHGTRNGSVGAKAAREDEYEWMKWYENLQKTKYNKIAMQETSRA